VEGRGESVQGKTRVEMGRRRRRGELGEVQVEKVNPTMPAIAKNNKWKGEGGKGKVPGRKTR